MKLLHIDSSILGAASVSRRLSAKIVAEYRERHPDVSVVYRDLAAQQISHLTGAVVFARTQEAAPQSGEVQRELVLNNELIEEFLAADVIVIGAPMYNFGISTQLKAWIDRLAVAGKTFVYTPTGPKGLAPNKKVIVASARGGTYGADTPFAALDHQEKYLIAIFRLFGINHLHFARAEGVRAGAEAKQKTIESAEREIEQLVELE
jgi:FMN-dependent NADH-azoreductase